MNLLNLDILMLRCLGGKMTIKADTDSLKQFANQIKNTSNFNNNHIDTDNASHLGGNDEAQKAIKKLTTITNNVKSILEKFATDLEGMVNSLEETDDNIAGK